MWWLSEEVGFSYGVASWNELIVAKWWFAKFFQYIWEREREREGLNILQADLHWTAGPFHAKSKLKKIKQTDQRADWIPVHHKNV